jgi:hypothetical protein
VRAATAVALAVAADTVAAQQPRTLASTAVGSKDSTAAAPSPHRVWSGPTITAADADRLSATLARADSLARANRISDAAKLYWSVVVEQRAAAEYPADALRRIALMHFGLEQEDIAAGVFMELAESAAQFGDPTNRLRSLFDAALMYQHIGRTDRVGDCIRQIWPLLKSPAIPAPIRAEFAARLVGG